MTTSALFPVVFFDRDGTLNLDEGYTHRVEDLRWRDGATDAIAYVNARGWLAIVVTNQSGIGRGIFVEEDMHRFHARMQRELSEGGARIDAFFACAFHPQATIESYRHPNHPDRKPNSGMIVRAFAELPADPSRALIVGDQPTDVAAGAGAGIPGIQLIPGENVLNALLVKLRQIPWAEG